jgi:mono/diheme cytochrome c family protein
MRTTLATIAVVAWPAILVDGAPPPNSQPATDAARMAFAADVLPLLRRKCFGCHGDGKDLEGKLDLRTRAGMLKGGESGPALVPGRPAKSRLYQSVLRTGKLQMPPKERNKLTKSETETLRKWIAAGAPWVVENARAKPAGGKWDGKSGVKVVTSGGLSAEWTNRKYRPEDLWAYRPIRRVPLPKVAGAPHPIDAFVRRTLAAKGLSPAPRADRRTLLRRVTFDFTGLPPSPNEIDAFLKDSSPGAYRKLIDRLLASKHYGEQQARHWLDVVRYADTSGFANDYERPNAWRYRDYVIRSFNADKPFDRFIVEQLAGDELDPDDPELLIAVGFLRMGPWEHSGMSVAAVTRQQYLDDVTNSVGVTFLGQPLRCARCHDHKFDPVPTRDYYRIQSVFAPVQFADRDVPYQPGENIRGFRTMKPRSQQVLNDARDFLASLRRKHQRATAEFLKKRGVKRLQDVPEAERPQRHYGLTRLDMSLQKIYQKRVDYFQRELKRYEPLAFSVYSGPFRLVQSNRPRHPLPPARQREGTVEPVRILAGGNLAAPVDRVTPGVLSAVAFSNDRVSPTAWNSIPNKTQGRRLAFARWVASSNNTLTARVIVNRIWQQHFGTGIVGTPNNFGKMGGKPSHPELLDWLATWFIEHGSSIKKLHRLILTSETYRQSGRHPDEKRLRTIDPKNRLLAFFPPRRMAAEEIRDAMLAITGKLNPEMGGPGVYPEINWEVATQPRHIMGSVAPAYQPSPSPRERNRRTIYAFRYRTLPDPLLQEFNRPNSEVSCERRNETTVTPQVFELFNGQFAHDRALALAARIAKKTKDRSKRVRAAFQRVYGRNPNKDELRLCTAHVAKMTAHHRRHKPLVVKPPTSVRRKMIEELTGESFTWTEPLDQMTHYQPDLKPWNVDAETRGLAELCLVLLNSNEFVYVR